MFALPISKPLLKALIFIKISLKLCYFCNKTHNFVCARAPPLNPKISALRALPPSPRNGPFPIANFWLRACCFYCCYVLLCKLFLQLAGVYGFPQTALSLNNFAHPCSSAFNHYSISALAQREENSVLNFV